MELIYGFHDSCIKEIKYISGAYVNVDLSMRPVNEQRILRIIFQRQFKNPSALEIEFIGLKHFRMSPSDENYTCEILDAAMIFKDNYIYWCDSGYVSESDLDTYAGTLICASRVRWRSVDEYIGPEEVYIARK
ncbi:hypothetical protein SDC9_211757 [bioreactor metagenome]|uniref:Uncharacterized protein n=1 Tax=bioreactor metagenome TaxID=1076179 RepID=A0A645JJZ2_9ZZZZ